MVGQNANMKNILIGSQAAKNWFKDFPRKPADTDYITEQETTIYTGFKYILDNNLHKNSIATPETLFTLKMSHIYWDIWWDKTLYDIVYFQNKGLQINQELYNLLYKDWEKKYQTKKIKMDKSNEEFFKDNVNRKYVHDDIHQSIAFYDKPLYEKVKTDLTKAALSKKLFDQLTKEDQIKLALEEINVVSLERFLIPSNFKIRPKAARYKAIKQLVVSMSKGWFPKFIIDNFKTIHIENKNNQYIQKFKDYFNNQIIIR